MDSVFTPEFFQGNRRRLRELFVGTAPIVLTANGLLQKSTDSSFPFKQDSSFWYLTGIQEPNVVVVIDKNKEYLIVPELSDARIAFDGDIDVNELIKRSGITDVIREKEGRKRLGSRIKRAGSVAVLSPGPAYVESLGMYTNPARKRLIRQLKEYNANLELQDLRQHLGRMRIVKQPVEIEVIQKAIDATVHGLNHVEKKFRAGSYDNEFEIELDLTRQFWRKGAAGHSFTPIIAAGAKGVTLHPTGNNNPISTHDQLLVDVGAEYVQYAADISRTWMVEPTKRFEAVYTAVREVADLAMSLLKPGVILKDYEKQVEAFMGEKLRELGLIKTIEHNQVRRYFPHATSHFLGIDVHDVGDYKHPVESGVVVTVEPGIYIPEEGIGVRIEDDILITTDGCQNLSAKLSR